MGCCGETRQPGEDRQVQPEPIPFLVNQQPSPHPGLQPFYEKSFTPPNINSPPLAQHFNGQANGYGMQQTQFAQQQWAGNDPRQGGSRFSTPVAGSNMPISPQSSYTPLLDPNVVRPSPVHAVPRSNTMSSAMSVTSPLARTVNSHSSNPLTDEGRISVSIDFGTSSAYLCSLLIHREFRYNILRRGTFVSTERFILHSPAEL